MEYFTIKNWGKYQHYKDRSPPWIKIHTSVFEDYEFDCLQDASKLHLIMIWLLASKLGEKNPKIPNDAKWLQQQLHLKKPIDLKPLFDKGFLVPASGMLAECKQVARTEGEGEGETEGETEGEEGKTSRLSQPQKVLDYLNLKASKNFRPTPTNLGFISGRLDQGYSQEDFERVIDLKVEEWGDDLKMDQYLRPQTLFNDTKFSGYVNQKKGLTVDKTGPPSKIKNQLDMIKNYAKEREHDIPGLPAGNGGVIGIGPAD